VIDGKKEASEFALCVTKTHGWGALRGVVYTDGKMLPPPTLNRFWWWFVRGRARARVGRFPRACAQRGAWDQCIM